MMHQKKIEPIDGHRPAFTEEKVDIYEYPDKKNDLTETPTHLAAGDLHGNAMKLLFVCLRENILDFPGDHIEKEKNYKKLKEIYEKNKLEKRDIEEFRQIIDTLIVCNPELLQEKMLTLIGDELADRGSNDLFSLLLMKQMDTLHVPFSIMLSNHGAIFLEFYLNNFEVSDGHSVMNFANRPKAEGPQGHSLIALRKNLRSDLLDQDQKKAVNDAAKNWLTHLKLLDYDIYPDNKEITLYMHATVGFEIVEQLVNLLNKYMPVPHLLYTDNTPLALAKTIDNINSKFHEILESKNEAFRNKLRTGIQDKESALYRLIWQRDYIQSNMDEHPNNKSYAVRYVHGHDTPEPNEIPKNSEGVIFNTNDTLGKGKAANIGVYKITTCEKGVSPSLINDDQDEVVLFDKINNFLIEAVDHYDDIVVQPGIQQTDKKLLTAFQEYFSKFRADINNGKKHLEEVWEDTKENFTEELSNTDPFAYMSYSQIVRDNADLDIKIKAEEIEHTFQRLSPAANDPKFQDDAENTKSANLNN